MCTPFVLSMRPPVDAGKDLPRIDVSALYPGTLITYDEQREDKWSSRYIIYKDRESEITTFLVPLYEGKVRMPDLKWWRWGVLCTNFGPTIIEGMVDPSSHFKCQGPEKHEWWDKENVWDINGVNLGRMTEDMEKINFSVEGKYLVPYKGQC